MKIDLKFERLSKAKEFWRLAGALDKVKNYVNYAWVKNPFYFCVDG